ncbi:DUF4157 domain-containing protein [Chitinophaga niabensis]|uniref:eCIS core domain-containing protein n=1 Tax=Chitinophaga niabensis TaxID=536979 RepID=UPI0031B9FDB1
MSETLIQNKKDTSGAGRHAGNGIFFNPAIQTKLTVNEPGDRYEQEADAMADKVMRMPAAAGGNESSFFRPATMLQRKCVHCEEEEAQRKEVGPLIQRQEDEDMEGPVQRKCAACENEETVQRKESGVATQAESYTGSLNGKGSSMPQSERDFFEPRFGYDFSKVQLHTDSAANESARSLNAHAYTLGNNIVFRSHQYQPGTDSGRRLMAHELTHVIQQQSAVMRKIQRSCLTGAVCTPPICGSPGTFGTSEEAIEAPARTARRAAILADPVGQAATGHSRRAANIEAVLAANGVAVTPTSHGVFVDLDVSPNTGAFTMRCSSFDTWVPPFAGPATARCIFVPNRLEQEADTFQNNPAQATIGGMTRNNWLMQLKIAMTHELQHIIYDAVARPALPGVTCLRTTVIDGHTVRFFLSEMSAEMSEFPPLFENVRRRSPDYSTMMTNLRNEYNETITNCSESIEGILKSLRCHCDCADVTAYLEETIAFTQSGWTTTQKNVFRELMINRFPALNWTRRRF